MFNNYLKTFKNFVKKLIWTKVIYFENPNLNVNNNLKN